jgi:hypothetical protein
VIAFGDDPTRIGATVAVRGPGAARGGAPPIRDPRASTCGHAIKNIGSEHCEIIGVLDGGNYVESTLIDRAAKAPLHVPANNLGGQEGAFGAFRKPGAAISAPAYANIR